MDTQGKLSGLYYPWHKRPADSYKAQREVAKAESQKGHSDQDPWGRS